MIAVGGTLDIDNPVVPKARKTPKSKSGH